MLGDLPPHSSDTLLEVRLRGVLHDGLAGGGGAGERDAVDVHVQRQRLARGVAEARHHVEHARAAGPLRRASSARRSAVSGDFSDGLSTSELPAASTGPDLPRRHEQREIPRHDGADHADRLRA